MIVRAIRGLRRYAWRSVGMYVRGDRAEIFNVKRQMCANKLSVKFTRETRTISINERHLSTHLLQIVTYRVNVDSWTWILIQNCEMYRLSVYARLKLQSMCRWNENTRIIETVVNKLIKASTYCMRVTFFADHVYIISFLSQIWIYPICTVINMKQNCFFTVKYVYISRSVNRLTMSSGFDFEMRYENTIRIVIIDAYNIMFQWPRYNEFINGQIVFNSSSLHCWLCSQLLTETRWYFTTIFDTLIISAYSYYFINLCENVILRKM